MPQPAQPPLHRHAFRAMGSDNEVMLGGAGAAELADIASLAASEVQRIERKYSRYRDDSVVTAINRAAGQRAVTIDDETGALFAFADSCHRESDGRFDITSGALRAIWNRTDSPMRPDAATIARTLARIGWQHVEWNQREIRLTRAGMEIDLGGIGKEYAADRAATLCIDAGARHGCINLGGDVRVWGGRPDGQAWRVGVRHPRDGACALAGVDVIDGAVATSGDYERFVEIDGRRYCHIIDARTGEPVSAWQSISVLAPLAVVAGSHATIAMLQAERAPAFLARSELRWLGVDASGQVHDGLDSAGNPAARLQ